jgi:hypothetical protein
MVEMRNAPKIRSFPSFNGSNSATMMLHSFLLFRPHTPSLKKSSFSFLLNDELEMMNSPPRKTKN